MNTTQYFCYQCPCPQTEALQPSPLQETLQEQQVGLAQAPMKSLLLSLVPVWTRPCVQSPRVESLFPQVLWSCPAGLQSQMLWGLLLPMPDPQAVKADMGLRTLTPVGELQ